MNSISEISRRESTRYLRDIHLPRLRRALEILPPADLWWRPHEGVISFGTILRHLEGNVRQWILGGLGGLEDRRRRSREFADPDSRSAERLLAELAETVEQASEVIEGLPEAALTALHRIQGFEVGGLEAILHVVEHFAWHTGQAVWIAKARAGAGHGLAFFDDAALDETEKG
jgi:uncharacterized damage-inducible protein DinB